MLEATATHSRVNRLQGVALTPAAQAALSINDKHREVQRLGRTAKEIAAEIGEELIEVKQSLAHGEFEPWVKANCCLSLRRAQEYMKVARLKNADARAFASCETIQDALAPAKPKPTPKQELRAATLNDLRKVERLRALRDDPGASEGEKANAQAKLNEIEKEIGKVEDVKVAPEKTRYAAFGQERTHYGWKMEAFFIDRIADTLLHKAVSDPRTGGNQAYKELKKALKKACGGEIETIDKLLKKINEL